MKYFPNKFIICIYWNYTGSTIALSGSWGSWDDLYSLSLNQTPNTNVTFYNPSTLMPYNSTTTLISSDLDTSQAGYYSSLYESRVNRFTIIRWKIIYKVGTPTAIELTNSPYREYEYTYSTDWLDQLESVNTYRYENSVKVLDSYGYAYDYDDQGNPTTIYHFVYEGITYDHAILEYTGRQLDSIVIQDSSNTTLHSIQYEYNDQGYRTTKTVDGIKTTYHLQGDKVIVEETGNEVIVYTYDFNGTLISMNYDNDITDQTSGVEYYYITNQQGDITKLVDNTGHVIVEYIYDAWGNTVKVTDSSNSNISEINPYRYRGYRHDDETGLYYLNSRYYDSNTGRFINSDGLLGPQGNTSGNSINTGSINYLASANSIYSGYSSRMSSGKNGSSVSIDSVWNWGNTAIGSFKHIRFKLAVIEIALVAALIDGRGSDISHDYKSGAMNLFNQDEAIALNSKVFGFYKGSLVVRHNLPGSSCNIFGTIFLNSNLKNDFDGLNTLNHEWGHSVQEKIMGSLYVPFVAVPSFAYFLFGDDSVYYSQPWERMADYFGGVNRGNYTPYSFSWGVAYTIAPYYIWLPYIIFG